DQAVRIENGPRREGRSDAIDARAWGDDVGLNEAVAGGAGGRIGGNHIIANRAGAALVAGADGDEEGIVSRRGRYGIIAILSARITGRDDYRDTAEPENLTGGIHRAGHVGLIDARVDGEIDDADVVAILVVQCPLHGFDNVGLES